MISTIEFEIQRISSGKSIFLSTIAIVMAIILLILGSFNTNNVVVTVVVLILYMVLFLVFFFNTSKELNNLYAYLNELRYAVSNK
jgi:Ca2+/Na+ antiporter